MLEQTAYETTHKPDMVYNKLYPCVLFIIQLTVEVSKKIYCFAFLENKIQNWKEKRNAENIKLIYFMQLLKGYFEKIVVFSSFFSLSLSSFTSSFVHWILQHQWPGLYFNKDICKVSKKYKLHCTWMFGNSKLIGNSYILRNLNMFNKKYAFYLVNTD